MARDQRLIRSLRNTKVAVVHPQDEDCANLELQLKRIGCQVSSFWPAPKTFADDIDAVFFLVEPEADDRLIRLAEDRKAALVALIGFESPLVLKTISDANIHGTMTKPVRPFGVLATLVAALSIFNYERRLIARIDKLDETLKTRRLVERATKILAKHKTISDDEAYSLIRREAMNKQVTLFEMASSIINADNVFLSGP